MRDSLLRAYGMPYVHMPKGNKPTSMREFVCKEVVVHGVTGKKRVCGKVIQSLYPNQFAWFKSEHLAKHRAKKDGITVEEALAKAKTQSE